MKTILKYLVIIIAVITIDGCSKDDSPEPVQVETWSLVSQRTENAHDFNDDGVSSQILNNEINCQTNLVLKLSSDGTGIQELEKAIVLYYDTSGSNYFIGCYLPQEIGLIGKTDLTWSQNGNNIAYIVDGQAYNGIITENQLTVVIPNGFFVPDETGEIYVDSEDLTLIFNKQ